MRARRRPRRAAFTLVELMVVVVILSVLVALLLPVLMGAQRTARNAAVTAEFTILAAKLEMFRDKYGEYPPSRIILPEDGAWNTADATVIPTPTGGADITYGELAQRTVTALRRYWPGIPISTTTTPLFDGSGTWYDFDGDARFDGPAVPGRGKVLDGTEALVFWLGGIPMDTGTTGDPEISPSGFSRQPFPFPGLGTRPHPFRNNLEDGNLAFSGVRDPAFHEFAPARIVDADGDGFPEYLDGLGADKPIAYFRADGTQGYDPNDCNLPEPDGTGAVKEVMRAFRVSFVTRAASGPSRLAISPAPNPFSTNPANTGTTTAWHKPGSFQLISAGADGLFGPAGRFKADGKTPGEKLPLEDTPAGNLNSTDKDLRMVEYDNLTSFSSGPLGQ